MPRPLLFALLVKSSATLLFLAAVIVAAFLNRSFLLVPILAFMAALSQFVSHKIVPPVSSGIRQMLDPNASSPNAFNSARRTFILNLVLYIMLYVVALGLSAIFQETEVSRLISLMDLGFIMGVGVVATLIRIYNSKQSETQVMQAMDKMRAAVRPGSKAGDPKAGDDFIIEGEVLDPDNRDL